jgi:polyphenol oxidase
VAIPLITAPNLSEIPALVHGFTSREGGVSEEAFRSLNLGMATGDDDDRVRENWKILAKGVGMPFRSFTGLRQVHGGVTVVAESEPRFDDPFEEFRFSPEGDALVTDLARRVLFVRVADCFPILLVDERSRGIGVCHAGWRGTLARVVPNAIRRMKEDFGTDPEDLRIAVGPGIGWKAFEVASSVAQLFEAELGAREDEISGDDAFAQIDLAAINIRLAIEAGVRPTRIWSSGLCTFSEKEKFFSYRRDGKHSGRMIGFIGWRA